MASVSTNNNFHITAADDETRDLVENPRKLLWDTLMSHNRFIRFSQHADSVKTTRKWVVIKVFKLDSLLNVFRKNQELYISTYEMNELLRQAVTYYPEILSSLDLKHEAIEFPKEKHAFKISHIEDTSYCHWFKDIAAGKFRLVRLSYFIFNVSDSWNTTYVYIKVFKKEGHSWMKHRQIGMRLTEFDQILYYGQELRQLIYA